MQVNNKFRKLRVGVYIGGKTLENEVSLNSGRTVCDHLDVSKYDIIPIFHSQNGNLYILTWKFLHRGKISDFEHRLESEVQKIVWDDLKLFVDFIYIASHGHFVEDGTLQGMLEILQIPYLGSKVLASALSMDKIIQKDILKFNNIAVPNGLVVSRESLEIFKKDSNLLIKSLKDLKINLPVIIKPIKEGSSFGITVVHKEEELLSAVVKAVTINKNCNQEALIEEFLSGMEFTCIVITDYKNKNLVPLQPTEIVLEKNTEFFDYNQKYMPGRAMKYTPARCSEKIIKKIQDECIKVMNVLEIENIARIDGFVTAQEKIVIIDPNTLSGMAPSSFIFMQAAENNMTHTDLINHLIETELNKYDLLKTVANKDTNKNETEILNNKKVRVAVLFGGKSHEREISLESGRNVVYKLSPEKYQVIPIFVDQNLDLYTINQNLLVRNNTIEITQNLKQDSKVKLSDLPKIADFVFLALHGGEGENGCFQGALETLSLPYNGSSVLASAICMNKFKTNEFLKMYGFEVPKNKLISKADFILNQKSIILAIESEINYPLIVKPHDDGCSVLVNRAQNNDELLQYINLIFSSGKNFVLIEEFLIGMELTVGIIGNNKVYALPPSQVVSSSCILSIEEKFLPGQGENQTPAHLENNALEFIRKNLERAFKALNCKGYARIDCFYQSAQQSLFGKERLIILEFNTLPALTPATCLFAQAAEIGLKPMEFIDLIIQLGFEEHRQIKLSREVEALINQSCDLSSKPFEI